jgi:hypothetical protein
MELGDRTLEFVTAVTQSPKHLVEADVSQFEDDIASLAADLKDRAKSLNLSVELDLPAIFADLPSGPLRFAPPFCAAAHRELRSTEMLAMCRVEAQNGDAVAQLKLGLFFLVSFPPPPPSHRE